jgi:hypothetical protein
MGASNNPKNLSYALSTSCRGKLDAGVPSPSFDKLRTGQALSQKERDFTPSGTAGGSLRSNGVPTGVPLAGVRAGDEGLRYV